MKKLVMMCGVSLLIASSAFAALSRDEVKRLADAGAILTELRNTPDKGIPEQLWDKAECVIVIPSMKKAAFVVGGEYGSGVMSCRQKGWSAPVFMQLAKGSWGLQIGAEATDLVLLVMNRRGLDKLLDDKVSLGADASVAAGPVGRTGGAATDAQLSAEMLSYSRSHGVFAGIDLSGGVLRPDKEADARAYGANVSAKDVVMGAQRVTAPEQAKPFLNALRNDVRGTTGRK
ncbi:MAG TPA: lipid-binding SYLF domain-containing protein [Vicinamibacterales bacterium]|nr:lipid-binding SYLF domain-containing protein [Vicinamibacterales bacterium]